MPRPLIIFHSPCSDGYAAAWAANQYFLGDVDLHPTDYYVEPPWDKITNDTDVYILDYSYSREKTEEIAAKAKRVKILDHHASHQTALAGLPYATFDMERSGAGLTWDFFYGKGTARHQPRPWIIDYVEDRDLWRNRLPNTRDVNAYINTLPFDMAAWNNIQAHSLEAIINKGQAVNESIRSYVSMVKKSAVTIEFEGYPVPFVNAQPPFISELLNELCQNVPFAVGWHMSNSGFKYSLRSSSSGVDVSKIAGIYGGGGHKAAAGFILSSPLAHISQYKFK